MKILKLIALSSIFLLLACVAEHATDHEPLAQNIQGPVSNGHPNSVAIILVERLPRLPFQADRVFRNQEGFVVVGSGIVMSGKSKAVVTAAHVVRALRDGLELSKYEGVCIAFNKAASMDGMCYPRRGAQVGYYLMEEEQPLLNNNYEDIGVIGWPIRFENYAIPNLKTVKISPAAVVPGGFYDVSGSQLNGSAVLSYQSQKTLLPGITKNSIRATVSRGIKVVSYNWQINTFQVAALFFANSNELLKRYIDPNQSTSPDSSVIQPGDSGGPFLRKEGGNDYLVGVVSGSDYGGGYPLCLFNPVKCPTFSRLSAEAIDRDLQLLKNEIGELSSDVDDVYLSNIQRIVDDPRMTAATLEKLWVDPVRAVRTDAEPWPVELNVKTLGERLQQMIDLADARR